MDGPASRTKTRTLSPVSTWIGLSMYWLATPLKTTKSGAGAPAAALVSDAGSPWGPRYHSLWTKANSWSTGSQAALGLDDDHAEHAVGDVVQRRGGAAVVHPDAGVLGLVLVELLLARVDRGHLVVPGDHRLAWKSMECGSWFVAGFLRWTRIVSPTLTRITGPGTVPPNVQTFTDEARGDGHVLLSMTEVDVVDGALEDRRAPSGRGRRRRGRSGRPRRRSWGRGRRGCHRPSWRRPWRLRR